MEGSGAHPATGGAGLVNRQRNAKIHARGTSARGRRPAPCCYEAREMLRKQVGVTEAYRYLIQRMIHNDAQTLRSAGSPVRNVFQRATDSRSKRTSRRTTTFRSRLCQPLWCLIHNRYVHRPLPTHTTTRFDANNEGMCKNDVRVVRVYVRAERQWGNKNVAVEYGD